MELMTEKHKHCVNPSCHVKAEGLNFNPRKSWKNASCPVALTHVTGREELRPVGTNTLGGGVAFPPPHHEDVKSEEAEGCGTERKVDSGWDKIFAFLDLFC